MPSRSVLACGAAATLLASVCGAGASTPSCGPRSESNDVSGAPYVLTGDVCPVHDPSIAYDADAALYVAFSTDMSGYYPPYLLLRCSHDLKAWALCGHIFDSIPAAIQAAVPGVTSLWAPDVLYLNGAWHVLYAASTFGSITSAVGVAVSGSLNPSNASHYGWRDGGILWSSDASMEYNAIDPDVSLHDGSTWMSMGSFWSGIKGTYLNMTSSLSSVVAAAGGSVTPLAQRAAPDAMEASFNLNTSGAWFLFTSWNYCCRGAASTYEVRVVRSVTGPQGPFVDAEGVQALSGGGTLVVGKSNGWPACGGQSVLREAPAPYANRVMILHAYDGVTGDPWMQLVGLNFSSSWPLVQPLV